MVYSIPLWQEILIYAYILISVTTFALLSKLKILGINLIPVKYRALISIFSPAILALLLALSPILILALLFLLIFMRKNNSNFRITIRKM
ncbi:MAG: hypothetical protein AABW87_03710 [Nanoarchaeota archaeon]